ncbi:MAG: DJ-1/PfpI family protein [Anaerolineales bacterium]|nr:DJ-1/PfpI family protein [Anaerolineales bacterium]
MGLRLRQPALGRHGLTIQTDASLEEVLPAEAPDLIVLPGGAAGFSALRLDPRVERLIRAGRPGHAGHHHGGRRPGRRPALGGRRRDGAGSAGWPGAAGVH